MGARELGGLRGDGVGAGYLIDRSAGVLVSSWGEKCFRKQGGGGVGRGPYPFFGGGRPTIDLGRGGAGERRKGVDACLGASCRLLVVGVAENRVRTRYLFDSSRAWAHGEVGPLPDPDNARKGGPCGTGLTER